MAYRTEFFRGGGEGARMYTDCCAYLMRRMEERASVSLYAMPWRWSDAPDCDADSSRDPDPTTTPTVAPWQTTTKKEKKGARRGGGYYRL